MAHVNFQTFVRFSHQETVATFFGEAIPMHSCCPGESFSREAPQSAITWQALPSYSNGRPRFRARLSGPLHVYSPGIAGAEADTPQAAVNILEQRVRDSHAALCGAMGITPPKPTTLTFLGRTYVIADLPHVPVGHAAEPISMRMHRDCERYTAEASGPLYHLCKTHHYGATPQAAADTLAAAITEIQTAITSVSGETE